MRLQTWTKWQEHVEREGMRFEPAPEYKVFPTPETPGLKPYQAAVRAARATQPLLEEFQPDAVVADILTIAAGLAAELAGAALREAKMLGQRAELTVARGAG